MNGMSPSLRFAAALSCALAAGLLVMLPPGGAPSAQAAQGLVATAVLVDSTGPTVQPGAGVLAQAAMGDADGSGYVDDDDLSLLLSNWGTAGGWGQGNFNADSKIDDDDLSLLLSNWTVAPPPPPPGVVSQIKVLSSKNPVDVHDLASWKNTFITAGMTDKEKGIAIWRSVATFQHQDSPPNEYLQWETNVLDPLKMFNVYGYSFCSVASANIQGLARYAGMTARGWTINAHVVPELWWNNSWHLLDASLINYFPKPDGELASVAEIEAQVAAWYAANPGYLGNQTNLTNYQKASGWTGWKNGPALLTASPFYSASGWWPANTHGWYSTMMEYDGSVLFAYESGSSMGYRVNIQLRPGEVLTRNWSNTGKHVNQLDGAAAPGCINGTTGQGSLVYTPQYGDIAPGRVGNGTLVYTPPLADKTFARSAWRFDNLATRGDDGQGPNLHVKTAGTDGILELRMACPYVYLSGTLAFNAVIGSGGRIDVYYSQNNGLTWTSIKAVTASGNQTVDLKSRCGRKYDYRLRFVLKNAGTGIETMSISHDIQHSQRPLPALGQGDNTITFAAGSEGTVTLEGSTNTSNSAKQIIYTEYSPVKVNMSSSNPLTLTGGTGSITFNVDAPADIKRLRVNTFYRARDALDAFDVDISYDGGTTWTTAATCAGPFAMMGKYIEITNVPAGKKSAKVRWNGRQRNTTALFNFRIDADYEQPNGGFRPVKITYNWTEGGVNKQQVHVARSASDSFTINCPTKPTMKSIVLELE